MEKDNFPKRPRTHVTGDRALKVFGYRQRPEWVTNVSESDYGWDILVTIIDGEFVKEDFLVQLKGSDSPDYICDNSAVSYPLEVKTINWLLSKPIPSMLCICDIGKAEEPIYWVWLQEVIDTIEGRKPNWREQGTLNIHIPTSQILKGAYIKIENYVRDHYTNLRIDKSLGDIIGNSFGTKDPEILATYRNDPSRFVQQKIAPHLKEAGIVDIIREADNEKTVSLSPEDRKRQRKISESSKALDELRDDDAQKILDGLQVDIESASDNIKAKFFNNKGALALHLQDEKIAFNYFKKAHKLQPYEPKFLLNLLYAEYLLTSKSASTQISLPDNWKVRLDAILLKNPDYPQAIQLKMIWLGRTQGPQASEAFLKNTFYLDKEPLMARMCLAEIYKNAGILDQDQRLLKDAESLGIALDPNFWDLYGCVLLQKTLGYSGVQSEIRFWGFGPSALDLKSLYKAAECYQKAFQMITAKGLPSTAERIVINYSAILNLLDEPDEAERVCKIFLDQHPNNYQVQKTLASSLYNQGKPVQAIPYARKAFTVDSSDSTTYRNYALCLAGAEEFEELLKLISTREKQGFLDKEEKSLSNILAVNALCELGDQIQARKRIEVMKTDQLPAQQATIAEASMAQRNGASKEEILKIYREAIAKHPSNVHLRTEFLINLRQATGKNAEEIIACITIIIAERQLTPDEYRLFGTAYLAQGQPELANQVFDHAINRFPHESQFLYWRAMALSEIGDFDSAFNSLQQLIHIGGRNYSVLRNLAILAIETGRLDKAIGLFQMALNKAKTKEVRGRIHCQLYELKKRRGDPPKEILRHVIEFGKTVEQGDVDQEAAFLMMCLLAPQVEGNDREAEEWYGSVKTRLSRFSKAHPRFHSLMSFKVPKGASDKEIGFSILSDIAMVMLPRALATTPLRLAMRNKVYPLAFRAQYLPESHSIFDFWSLCTRASDFSYAIHIWHDFNILENEMESVSWKEAVCIDITALLSMAELDQFDFLSSFPLIIIAKGTKIALEKELSGYNAPHPLAKKVEIWRLKNRYKIRIRGVIAGGDGFDEEDEEDNEDEYEKKSSGIFIRRESPLNKIIGAGIGETLLLAKKLRIPLYSDDAIIRFWAFKDYGVKAFSSMSLIKKLRMEKYLTPSQETKTYTEMIKKNFQIVLIEPIHFNTRLQELLANCTQKAISLNSERMLADNILGILLRQFGDQSLNEIALSHLAVNWWLSILTDDRISINILTECMIYPSFCLSMRTKGKILTGISKNETELKGAHLWAFFLWRAYLQNDRSTSKAWLAIKSCCCQIFNGNLKKQEKVLYKLIPKWLAKEADEDPSVHARKKLDYVVALAYHFPRDERFKFEEEFIKIRPKFMKR